MIFPLIRKIDKDKNKKADINKIAGNLFFQLNKNNKVK
jgi:hypothetical protein